MTKLILIRHGCSINNASGCYTGQLDAPLNDLGREQAARLADALCTFHIDATYASDLCRAMETLRPTAERLGLPLITDPALRELDTGLWTNVPHEEVKVRFAEDFARYLTDVDAPCTGGESARQACLRVQNALLRIVAAHEGQTVAVCTHALPCRLAACLADGKGVERVKEYKSPLNTSYTVYAVENGRFTALSTPQTAHLEASTQAGKPGLV